MKINALTEKYEHVELLGKPALFTSNRLDRSTVPEGLYCYDLRGGDDDAGIPVTLEESVGVNHAGTILSLEPFAFEEGKDYLPIENELNFLGELLSIQEFFKLHGSENYALRPASPDEAGMFYALTPEQDKQLGAIGCVRIDFGRSGKEFWHTWWPRGPDELNSPEFKAELGKVADMLRESVLKDLLSMRRYCRTNGGAIDGGICTQNYGYTIETGRYIFRLRCNPVENDYNAYLSCFVKPALLKLYMPLTGELYERNEYGDLENDAIELDGSCLRSYKGLIPKALDDNRTPEENERGIMHWYDEGGGLDKKVQSVVFTAEERNGQLWGVAECHVTGTLTPQELAALTNYIESQVADGWGEIFEQQEIRVDGGAKLYVHLWNSDNWSIMTEAERFAIQ